MIRKTRRKNQVYKKKCNNSQCSFFYNFFSQNGYSLYEHTCRKAVRTDLVKTSNNVFVVLAISFDHSGNGIAEPFFEFAMRLEHVWHQEMHE